MKEIELHEGSVDQIDFQEQEQQIHQNQKKFKTHKLPKKNRFVQQLDEQIINEVDKEFGDLKGRKLSYYLKIGFLIGLIILCAICFVIFYNKGISFQSYEVSISSLHRQIVLNPQNKTLLNPNYIKIIKDGKEQEYIVFQVKDLETKETNQLQCLYNFQEIFISVDNNNCQKFFLFQNLNESISELRVSERNSQNKYYFTYRKSQKVEDNIYSQLNLVISQNDLQESSFEQHGNIIKAGPRSSRSGVILFRDHLKQPPLLFFGEGDIFYGEFLSEEIKFDMKGILIQPRSNKFDSLSLEIGPSPIQLENGDYIFFYNSKGIDNRDFSNLSGIGYAILNGNNPLTITQRSQEPLIMEKSNQRFQFDTDKKSTQKKMFVSSYKKISEQEYILFVSDQQNQIELYKFFIKPI